MFAAIETTAVQQGEGILEPSKGNKLGGRKTKAPKFGHLCKNDLKREEEERVQTSTLKVPRGVLKKYLGMWAIDWGLRRSRDIETWRPAGGGHVKRRGDSGHLVGHATE